MTPNNRTPILIVLICLFFGGYLLLFTISKSVRTDISDLTCNIGAGTLTIEDPVVLFTEWHGGYVFPDSFFEHYKSTGSIHFDSDSVYKFYTEPSYVNLRFSPI